MAARQACWAIQPQLAVRAGRRCWHAGGSRCVLCLLRRQCTRPLWPSTGAVHVAVQLMHATHASCPRMPAPCPPHARPIPPRCCSRGRSCCISASTPSGTASEAVGDTGGLSWRVMASPARHRLRCRPLANSLPSAAHHHCHLPPTRPASPRAPPPPPFPPQPPLAARAARPAGLCVGVLPLPGSVAAAAGRCKRAVLPLPHLRGGAGVRAGQGGQCAG